MKWPSFTEKERRGIIVIAILAGIQALLIAGLLRWTGPASAYSSEKKELAAMKQELQAARTLIGQEAAVWQNLDQSITELNALTGYAPAQSDRYAWAYEYVSQRATRSEVSLDLLEEVAPVSDCASCPYEMLMSTRCDYNNLVQFLWRLEKDNPLLRVKQVLIDIVPGVTLAPRVQVTVQWLTSLEVHQVEKQAASVL